MSALVEFVKLGRTSLRDWSAQHLKIVDKGRRTTPFIFNDAQKYLDDRIEEQLRKLRRVRVNVLKGRQMGISTYVAARYFRNCCVRRNQHAGIMAHRKPSTAALAKIVKRFYNHLRPEFQPELEKDNENELKFTKTIDNSYSLHTAGSEGAGRGETLYLLHNSEVAFWKDSETHLAGLFEAMSETDGSEIINESTAQGTDNAFYKEWKKAERGEGDFINVFLPWWWDKGYRRKPEPGFRLSDEQPGPQLLSEKQYAEAYKLDDEQMCWRRHKILALESLELFMQEYPATPAEAFAGSSTQSFIKAINVVRAKNHSLRLEDFSEIPLVLGVDPSREGENRTALIRRRGRLAYGLKYIPEGNPKAIALEILRITREERPVRIFVDAGSGGGGPQVIDYLESWAETRELVVPVRFGDPAYDGTKAYCRRDELYLELQRWLQGDVGIPDVEGFEEEFLAARFHYDAEDRLRMEPKKAMLKRKIESTDGLDSLLCTLAEPAQAPTRNEIKDGMADYDPYKQEPGVSDESDWDVLD